MFRAPRHWLASLLTATMLSATTLTATIAVSTGDAAAQANASYWQEFAAAPLAHRLSQKPDTADINALRDHAALASFYEDREHRTVWVEDGKLNAAARRAIFFLSRTDRWGLDPDAFAAPDLSLGFSEPASASEIADAEVAMSRALLTYARHAHSGRTTPRDISPFLDAKPELPDPVEAMRKMADASDIVETLVAFNPQDEEFEVLRQELANLKRIATEGGWRTIGNGRTLKPGMSDERVVDLKQRLNVPMPPPIIADPQEVRLYDGAIVEAVTRYQEENGLEADGIVGPSTLAHMNQSVIDRIYTVLANMERWRWLPKDRGDYYVMVDIPGFEVNIVRDGVPFFTTRVVVGKPYHQTAVFSDEMEHIVVNPYWNVPRSIATEEMLPHLQNDPNYLAVRNFETVVDGTGRQVDPSKINWREFTPATLPFRFRQRPGRGNALGTVKFMFPNRHAIYLHDTPSKSLFQRTVRAYSHGCIRVYQPLEFADALLSNDPNLNAARVQAGINSRQNQTLPLSRKIPIHITYFTAWVENGRINYRNDIYGHDRRVAAALDWH